LEGFELVFGILIAYLVVVTFGGDLGSAVMAGAGPGYRPA